MPVDGSTCPYDYYTPPDEHGIAHCRGVLPLRDTWHCERCQADPAFARGMQATYADVTRGTGPCAHQRSGDSAHADAELVQCALVNELLGWSFAFPAQACDQCTRGADATAVRSLAREAAYHRVRLGDDPELAVTERVSVEQARDVLRQLGEPETIATEAYKRCRHRGAKIGEKACEECGGNARLHVFACALGLGERTADAVDGPQRPKGVIFEDCQHCAQAEAGAGRPVIVVLRHRGHRTGQDHHLSARIVQAGYDRVDLDMGPDPSGGLAAHIDAHGAPVATVRWEEHAGLWGEGGHDLEVTQWCIEHQVVPVYVDFAYFGHYGGLMFDRYGYDGRPSIVETREAMGGSFFPSPTRHQFQYFRMIYERYNVAQKQPPLVEGDYVAAFVQCHSPRSNLPCRGSQEWVDKVYEIFGDRVAFKAAPTGDVQPPEGARWFEHKADHPQVNANLAVHARYCLTNSSSITNEFFVAGLAVVVTGRSWYTGLDVFDEPAAWEELGAWEPRAVNPQSRDWYTDWWFGHQVFHDETTDVLGRVIAEGQEGYGLEAVGSTSDERPPSPAPTVSSLRPGAPSAPILVCLSGSPRHLFDLS